MENLKLNFTASKDETPIEITEELRKTFNESIKKLSEALGMLNYLVTGTENDSAQKGTIENCLNVANYAFHDLCKSFGIESPEQKKVSELQERCRFLNKQNRELRQQLGAKVSLEDSRENIKNVSAAFCHWWDRESAFGWLNELQISQYGVLNARLDFQVGYGSGRSEEEYHERAVAQGFDLMQDQKRYFPKATPENIAKIIEFCGKIGCKIHDFKMETSFENGAETFIDSANVSLGDFSKLEPWYCLKEE